MDIAQSFFLSARICLAVEKRGVLERGVFHTFTCDNRIFRFPCLGGGFCRHLIPVPCIFDVFRPDTCIFPYNPRSWCAVDFARLDKLVYCACDCGGAVVVSYLIHGGVCGTLQRGQGLNRNESSI